MALCGKFTAMASWRQVVVFSQPLESPRTGEDAVVTYRPMTMLPVIVFDREASRRRIVPMRWGFPHRSNPRRPEPIHARAETIDERPTFRDAFLNAQRGIVAVRTFNEGLELPNGKTEQHTVTPGDDAPLGMAFLWRRFEIEGQPLLACVLVTVPANRLISTITDRMPAFIREEDWSKWIGEDTTAPADAKALLRTVDGVRWTMAKEEKAAPKSKSERYDPGPGLF